MLPHDDAENRKERISDRASPILSHVPFDKILNSMRDANREKDTSIKKRTAAIVGPQSDQHAIASS